MSKLQLHVSMFLVGGIKEPPLGDLVWLGLISIGSGLGGIRISRCEIIGSE